MIELTREEHGEQLFLNEDEITAVTRGTYGGSHVRVASINHIYAVREAPAEVYRLVQLEKHPPSDKGGNDT